MRLDDLDLAIIATCYHRPRAPVTEVAKRLGVRADTFRRRLGALLEAAVMRQKAFPDLYALGYCQYEVSLAIASSKKSEDERFVRALIESDVVAWIGQYSGEYQYTFTICTTSPQQFHHTLNQLISAHRINIVKTQVATRLRYIEFPLRCLHPSVVDDSPLEFGSLRNLTIDSIDKRILRAMSQDSSRSTRALAVELSISQASLIQRLQRLEEQHILVGYSYVVDFSKLGLQAYCIIIKVRKPGVEVAMRLLQFARATKEISYFVESFGSYDFKLGVLLTDPSQILGLSQSIAELLADSLLSMQTLTAFDYRKVERYPFRDFSESHEEK